MEQKKNTLSGKRVQKVGKSGEKENFIKRVNLEKAMKEAGYSQTKLADAIGVSARAIGYYISGRNNIPEDNLRKIAEVLQVTPEYILGKTNHPDKDKLNALMKDMYDHEITAYKYTRDFLKECGINFEWNESDNSLYMIPKKGFEPIYINENMYRFLIDQVRSFTKDLFLNYYNSPLAFDMRLEHIKKTIKDSKKQDDKTK